jgi:small subunit ribosomal protein S8
MIAAIKNGQLAKKSTVKCYRKTSIESILNILWNEGFILGYKVSKKNPQILKIFLKYKNGNPVISSIKPVSKPGLKVYYSLKQLWKIESSKGTLVISTTRGFLSNNDCKKKKLGGEPFLIIK